LMEIGTGVRACESCNRHTGVSPGGTPAGRPCHYRLKARLPESNAAELQFGLVRMECQFPAHREIGAPAAPVPGRGGGIQMRPARPGPSFKYGLSIAHGDMTMAGR